MDAPYMGINLLTCVEEACYEGTLGIIEILKVDSKERRTKNEVDQKLTIVAVAVENPFSIAA